MSEKPFIGKVALVTGAAGAIGGATCAYLASQGARVVGVDNREGWVSTDKDVEAICTDLSIPQNIYKLLGAIADNEGRLDMVVHAAGLSIPAGWEDIRGDYITRQYWTNVASSVFITNISASLMAKSGGGHILLFGSGVEDSCSETHSIYAATKAAVRVFGETIAKELEQKAVYVNVIWPSAKSHMNPNSSGNPVNIARFIAALFVTNNWGKTFSVINDTVGLVSKKEIVPIYFYASIPKVK